MDLLEFKQRVLPARQKLYRLAAFLLQNREEAEDVLQDVFLKLWTNKEKLGACNSIEAFAMRVTKNLCLDRLKAKKRKHMVDVAELELELNSEGVSPYKSYELADSINKVQELVSILPEQQRLILHLRDVEGYTFEEMEQITNLTVNNMRVILSRARKSVRDGFLKLENYEAR
ncbi:RNA polymerase sigma-70 factor (ECF subfamily) [Pontibacter aydingkolensis]|uniref:Sigma-70 family RNA polymerase sigma factor n=1 Tax=Pontibacter aydingkolensis TaxID=1911536 RepID=A0ABS7CT74_9BACT|nr:sigma-70 family RNA polymerase sigma factor [Pontibacter aydingkolensis]MBW7467058.1 sigma-70 family RNA polymerase sigma factor [Pontibacter aydingkolensis]